MAYIDQTQTKKEIEDAIRGNSVSNVAPTKVSDTVQLVAEINPKLLRRCNVVKAASTINNTSGSIYTTPLDKDFYLVACSLSVNQDVTATSIYSRILVTIDGAANLSVLRIDGLTLTPRAESVAISFPTPIKIDRGTVISIGNSTNVANCTVGATIVGYTVEP